MIEAAIDIGTNTMLLLIADVEAAAEPGSSALKRRIGAVFEDHIDFVRLGQGVHSNHAFAPAAMERALQCFRKYKSLCEKHGVKKIRALATSASRDARNARAFYEQVKVATGIDVQIITGELEAKLSFLGGLLPFQEPVDTAILDIGGGSTEFVIWNGDAPHGQSLDMGCVRAAEIFFTEDPYRPQAIAAMESHFKEMLGQIDPALRQELRAKEWTGIAGTPTALAGTELSVDHFDGSRIDGYRMSRESILKWLRILASQTHGERAAYPLIGAGRADLIVPGIVILNTAMEFFGKEELIVSSRGLRHGVFLSPPPDAV